MEVSLRKVKSSDLELLLAWAHVKMIWEYLPTSREGEYLTWENHYEWWVSRENREDWMIMVDGRSVGTIIIHLKSSEIGIYIGEVTLWGKRVGSKALKLGILRMMALGFEMIWAAIHPENIASVKLFTGLGFKKAGKARGDVDRYELDLRTTVRPKSSIRAFKVGDRLGSPASAL